MSQQELQRVEVIAMRRSGKINQAEAARRLGVSVRQVRRLEAKVAARGAAGLRSARRGPAQQSSAGRAGGGQGGHVDPHSLSGFRADLGQ